MLLYNAVLVDWRKTNQHHFIRCSPVRVLPLSELVSSVTLWVLPMASVSSWVIPHFLDYWMYYFYSFAISLIFDKKQSRYVLTCQEEHCDRWIGFRLLEIISFGNSLSYLKFTFVENRWESSGLCWKLAENWWLPSNQIMPVFETVDQFIDALPWCFNLFLAGRRLNSQMKIEKKKRIRFSLQQKAEILQIREKKVRSVFRDPQQKFLLQFTFSRLLSLR